MSGLRQIPDQVPVSARHEGQKRLPDEGLEEIVGAWYR